jgi:hypothetical protein
VTTDFPRVFATVLAVATLVGDVFLAVWLPTPLDAAVISALTLAVVAFGAYVLGDER